MRRGERKTPRWPRTAVADGSTKSSPEGAFEPAHRLEQDRLGAVRPSIDPLQSRRRASRTLPTLVVAMAMGMSLNAGIGSMGLLVDRPALGFSYGPGDGLPDGILSDVKIEGNTSITDEQIRAKLLSKKGSQFDARAIDADIKSLIAAKWFAEVIPEYSRDPKDPAGKSIILIFTVKEMPVLTQVEFRGLTKLKLKDVEEATGLKKGARGDAGRSHLAVEQIKRLYAEKGYELAEVKLLEGGKLGDTRIVIGIFEGPQFVVDSIDFKGNVFANDATLHTKITSRTRLFGLLFGKFHRDTLEEDARKLKEYYQSQGFYEIAVTPVTRSDKGLGKIGITYVISEGTRYYVRNISFEGNKQIPTEKLKEGLALHSGQPILDSVKEADRKNLMTKYYALGCIDTQIMPEPRYTDELGVVDIVYHIQEGEPYIMGHLKISGNERTKEKVIRREAVMAGLIPGEPLDFNRVEIFKQRLGGTGFFQNAPDQGKPIDVQVVNKRPHDRPYGDDIAPDIMNEVSLTRMQDPGPEPEVQLPPMSEPPAIPGPGSLGGPADGGTPAQGNPFGGSVFSPEIDAPPITVPSVPDNTPLDPNLDAIPPGGAPAGPPPTNPIGTGEPPGTIPSFPGLNANDNGPDRQDPFPGRAWADIVTSVEEAPTGKFMLGAGVSSFQGINGSLSVSEKNFDLFNVPKSWGDLIGGNAFRGKGQQLSIDLMPGTLINRFQVSLREPYLFDLPIGASGAGYYFNRMYPNWTERRGGGKFSLGRQFGTSIYADTTLRVENVTFFGYSTPAPADYLAASGNTFLASVRPSIRFDNRNSPISPNKGQYLEFAFEEGFGTFVYPKIEAEGKSYFTTGERADGSGKRLLIFRGHVGATGPDTPVYERFFAGNFASLRGFQYRGVGPYVLGKNIGGTFEALGSVEYQFPLSANDMFHQVVFCDFGTVNNTYNLEDFRVSVGTGLRINIRAMGPLPLCFDLAFPVAKAANDRVQFFNFSIGAFW